MLSIIDQHWREHLFEMDYLREGINLRAMGQRDPLAEWQREGFDMFEAMMGVTEDDFVAYVSHLQVVTEDQPQPADRNLPLHGGRRRGRRCRSACGHGSRVVAAELGTAREAPPRRWPKTTTSTRRCASTRLPGRNEPCYCGSGKKSSSATAADCVRPQSRPTDRSDLVLDARLFR